MILLYKTVIDLIKLKSRWFVILKSLFPNNTLNAYTKDFQKEL